MSSKKEYKCIYVDDDVETSLNEYAEDGWELVCPSCVKWWFVLVRDKKMSSQNQNKMNWKIITLPIENLILGIFVAFISGALLFGGSC